MTEIQVTKASHCIQIHVDADGTPLCQHGDRMVEVEPNQWQCPDLIALAGFFRNALTGMG